MKQVLKESVSQFIHDLQVAIKEETDSIDLYEKMLKSKGDSLTDNISSVIKEILDDEKDHLVLLSTLLSEEIEANFPDYGDDEEDSLLSLSVENYDEESDEN